MHPYPREREILLPLLYYSGIPVYSLACIHCSSSGNSSSKRSSRFFYHCLEFKLFLFKSCVVIRLSKSKHATRIESKKKGKKNKIQSARDFESFCSEEIRRNAEEMSGGGTKVSFGAILESRRVLRSRWLRIIEERNGGYCATIRACTRGGPEVGRLLPPPLPRREPLRFPKDGRSH